MCGRSPKQVLPAPPQGQLYSTSAAELFPHGRVPDADADVTPSSNTRGYTCRSVPFSLGHFKLMQSKIYLLFDWCRCAGALAQTGSAGPTPGSTSADPHPLFILVLSPCGAYRKCKHKL